MTLRRIHHRGTERKSPFEVCVVLRQQGALSDGSATPMRGKSPTCREVFVSILRSTTATKGRIPERNQGRAGKSSETCRASAWQRRTGRQAHSRFETAWHPE